MTEKKSRKRKDPEIMEDDRLPEPVDTQTSGEDQLPEEVSAEEEKVPGSPEEQIAEWNDKYLRLYSEFDNYRRRTLKEKIDLSKTASAEIITCLLPVLDDFERAIRAIPGNVVADPSLQEGIILIYNKFLNILTQKGLEQMKTIGEDFDTDFHEAVTKIPVPSPELKGKVVDEVEKGYLLNGKVIRFAKVVVGS